MRGGFEGRIGRLWLRVVMRTTFLVGLTAVIASVLCPCQSSRAQDGPVQASPPARVIVSLSSHPVPTGLAEFGTRGDKAIRVTVYGQVNRPGIYYFPPGASVRDALREAQGLQRLFWWGNSYLVRPTNESHGELISFLNRRQTWQELALQAGDQLYLGYEVY